MYRLHHYRWVPGLTFRRHARDPSSPGRTRPGVDADVWMAVLPAPAGGRKPGQTPPERNSCRPTWPPARPPMSAGRSRRPMAPAGSKLGAATPRERPLDLDGCHMGDQLSHLLHVQETTPRFLPPHPPPFFFFTREPRAVTQSAAHHKRARLFTRGGKPHRISAFPALRLNKSCLPAHRKKPTPLRSLTPKPRSARPSPPQGKSPASSAGAGTQTPHRQPGARPQRSYSPGTRRRRRGEPASPRQPCPGWESCDGPEQPHGGSGGERAGGAPPGRRGGSPAKPCGRAQIFCPPLHTRRGRREAGGSPPASPPRAPWKAHQPADPPPAGHGFPSGAGGSARRRRWNWRGKGGGGGGGHIPPPRARGRGRAGQPPLLARAAPGSR